MKLRFKNILLLGLALLLAVQPLAPVNHSYANDPSQFGSPNQQFFDNDGNILAGGKLYFYEAGTSTPIDTYSNAARTIANSNPIILDAAGRAGAIYMNPDEYKIVLKTSTDTTIWTRDDYTVAATSSVGSGLETIGGALRTTALVNNQTGTSYTILTGDRSKLVTLSNANPVAVTLPQAGTNFPDGWYIDIHNRGAGVVTITPTTSTIDGAATLVLNQNEGSRIFSDGTNYFTQRGKTRALSLTDLGFALDGLITGYLPTSIAGTNTTASITFTAGAATDSTGAYSIKKASTTSWAVSNGNAINGYQGGTTLPNSDTIHFFVCYGSTGIGTFAHNAVTPTCPSGYNLGYRRITSINTTGAGALIPYTAIETEGGGIEAVLTTMLGQTISVTTSSALYALSGIPTDIRVKPIFSSALQTNGAYAIISTSEATSAAPAQNGTAPGANVANNGGQNPGHIDVITDTSAQIRARSSANDSLYVYVYGWKDFRR